VNGIDGGGRRTSNRRGGSFIKCPLLNAGLQKPMRVMPSCAQPESSVDDNDGEAIPFAAMRWRRRAADRTKTSSQELNALPIAPDKKKPPATNGHACATAGEKVVEFQPEQAPSKKESSVRVVDVSIS